MTEFSSPGVYVREAASGPGPIAGVSTSNMGLLGYTPRGPVDEPTLCNSFTEFAGTFGTFTADGLAAHMAYAFFANGGKRLYMVRVTHDDAVAAQWDLTAAVTAEDLGHDVEPTGKYDLQLAHPPILVQGVGSVVITMNGAPDVVFTDNGVGALTGVGAAGGTGVIDYVTGAVSLQLNNPADYAGGANHIMAAYSYRVLRFALAWPGLAGNKFRLIIQPGNDDFLVAAQARWTRFTVILEEDVSSDPTAQVWSEVERFEDLVFDDAASPSFVGTVLNDTIKGSTYLAVTSYGNEINPAALAGVAVANEDLSATQVPAYDGSTKAFAFTLASDCFPGTVSAEFRFRESLLAIGMGDGTATPACASLGCPILPGGGTVPLSRVQVRLTRTGGGATVLYDDGVGAVGSLRTGPFPGTIEGTITYATGAVALNLLADTAVIGAPITITCEYVHPVTVVDDRDGGLSIATPAAGVLPPTKFQLNSAGPNTVDYDTGALALVWQLAGAPAAGPAGVGASTGASKVGAVGTYNIAAGGGFTLNVDGAGVLPIAFNGTQGVQTSSNAWPVANQIGLTIIVEIDGVAQTVLFAGATTTAAHVAAEMNAQLSGAWVSEVAGDVVVHSDSKGTGSTVLRTGGTSAVTWAVAVDGTGNVANLAAVTPTEVQTIVEAATIATVSLLPAGAFTISSPTLGGGSSLVFAGTAGAAALGLSNETITGLTSVNGQVCDYYTNPVASLTGSMLGGLDGSATDSADLVSAGLAADLRGLYAFGKVDELMQLVAADFQTDPIVLDAFITYAELMGDKFVLGAVPHGLAYAKAATWRKTQIARNTKVCAIYYPHIKVLDPVSEAVVDLPPCGHLAGIYARTDGNANVSTAPAGTEQGVIGWAVGLEYDLTSGQVGALRDAKVNALVQWPATGRVVWGARTLDIAGGIWPFVPQVRLFQMVKKSIFLSTHAFVFRSNGTGLWAQVAATVNTYLKGLFTAGYMPSASTADQAYFVICDASNNDPDSNIVYCDVGIRVPQTTEFVVFTIGQMTV